MEIEAVDLAQRYADKVFNEYGLAFLVLCVVAIALWRSNRALSARYINLLERNIEMGLGLKAVVEAALKDRMGGRG